MKTAEEILKEIDECYGPCKRICISCPEGAFLKDIRDVIMQLVKENQELKIQAAQANSMIFF